MFRLRMPRLQSLYRRLKSLEDNVPGSPAAYVRLPCDIPAYLLRRTRRCSRLIRDYYYYYYYFSYTYRAIELMRGSVQKSMYRRNPLGKKTCKPLVTR
jgi:hypothetical protein